LKGGSSMNFREMLENKLQLMIGDKPLTEEIIQKRDELTKLADEFQEVYDNAEANQKEVVVDGALSTVLLLRGMQIVNQMQEKETQLIELLSE